MKTYNEFISEARLDWDQNMSRIASEIDKVFKYAKIKVLKHIPFKKQYRTGDAELYGAFITAKDSNGEKTVLPIEVDGKGIIRYAGGPSGWHELEVIGSFNMSHAIPDDYLKIQTYARTMDYLKHFQKMPGFGQDVIMKKESINEREMSIKDAFKDLVKDHGAKKALDMLADVLTGGALATMDDKKVKAFKKKLLKTVTTESINELEYTPIDLPDILDKSSALGKSFKKMAHSISKDLSSEENRAVGKALKAYNSYFEELKKVNKILK